MVPAFGCAVAAAVLLSLGALFPAVHGADSGYASTPVLIALAVLPLVLAGTAARVGRGGTALGVLAGAAVLAPGRAVLDLHLALDAARAVRPELYLADDLAAVPPGPGLWCLFAGHAATVLAGSLAVRTAGARFGSGGSGPPVGRDGTEGWGRRWLPVALVLAVVAGCAVLMAPFASTDPYLLGRNAFEGPFVPMIGHLVAAAAVPLGVAMIMTSTRPTGFVRGGVAGLAVAVSGFVVPDLAAAVAMPVLEVTAGPVVGVVAAVMLGAVTFGRAGRGGDGAASADPGPGSPADRGTGTTESFEAAVPGLRRLEMSTGVLALVTAGMAVLGSLAGQVSTPPSLPEPESPARWLLLTAAVLIALPGIAMFVPNAASLVRPVLSGVWVSVPLSGALVLDTAITAAGVGGVASSGPGAVWAWLAMASAVVTVVCAVITGVVEREEAGEAGEEPQGLLHAGVDGHTAAGARATIMGLRMLTPLVVAAVLAVAAFVTPVVVAPDYVEPGLWSDFSGPSWGLIAALLTVLGALALVSTSRPARAAALLVGVAGVLALRAATLPLVGAQIEGSGAGAGLGFALAGVAVTLWAAGVAARSNSARRTPIRR